MRFFSLIVTAFLLTNTHAQAQEVNVGKAIAIDKVISNDTMGPIIQHLALLIAQPEVPATIQVVIDSPGGSVSVGFKFLMLMHTLQGRGTKFECFVPSLAASMAFQILLNCDERYALNEAGLLWHRARVSLGGGLFGGGVVVTGPELLRMGAELADLDSTILDEVNSKLSRDMDRDEILYHFNGETMHQGNLLALRAPHFIKARSHIPGLLEALFSTKTVRTQSSRGSSDFRRGEMIYIKQNSVEVK